MENEIQFDAPTMALVAELLEEARDLQQLGETELAARLLRALPEAARQRGCGAGREAALGELATGLADAC